MKDTTPQSTDPCPSDPSTTGKRSRTLMERARELLPGGVSSPVRAYNAVGGEPLVIASGTGALITDVDGREYVDYVCSWGPLILGHAHPTVVEEVRSAAGRGTSFGTTNEPEITLAERVVAAIPSIKLIRFVNSGTEATMSAIRLARAATGRDLVLKFEGSYHGHADGLLASAGSGITTLGIPDSPGVPAAAAAQTLVVPYNNLAAVQTMIAAHPHRVACIIVEPVAGNMGVVTPTPEFLPGLRTVCDRAGALLIFDEVITGFRLTRGGAQERYSVRPDLTTLGKVIGGGLPIGAYGGSRVLMERVSPAGDVYQAGTLSGNPLTMAAGIATLNALDATAYERLDTLSARLETGLLHAIAKTGIHASIARVGSMLTLFFRESPPHNYTEARQSDTAAFAHFHRAMRTLGVHLPPSQFETWFVSLAHDDSLIDRTVEAAATAFSEVMTSS